MHRLNANVRKFKHLSVPDLPKDVTIYGKSLKCISEDTVSGQIGLMKHKYINDQRWVIFRDGLERVLSKYSASILTLTAYSSAIIHDNGRFVVVDSHSRSHVGLPVHDGKS